MAIDNWIKLLLGLKPSTEDEVVKQEWDRRTSMVCKPCWELKYCPYGPLVEDFPLPPPLKKDAIEHNKYLKSCLESGVYGPDSKPLDAERRKIFEEDVASFNEGDYPEEHSKFEREAACTVFGHICPVFFVNEPLTETEEMRRIGRHIPFSTKMRVARRDNYRCQVCGKNLGDEELEFDHIIPVSKGGSSEEHNIRLTCFECNRRKGAKLEI